MLTHTPVGMPPAAAAADCRAVRQGCEPGAVLHLLAQPGSTSMWPPAMSLALALVGSLGRQLEVDAPVVSSSGNGASHICIEEGKLSAAGEPDAEGFLVLRCRCAVLGGGRGLPAPGRMGCAWRVAIPVQRLTAPFQPRRCRRGAGQAAADAHLPADCVDARGAG